MNKKIQFKSLVLGIVAGAVIALSVGAATSNTRTVWEYRVTAGRANDLTEIINRNAIEGWEFASASGNSSEAWVVLRREKR